MNRNMRRIFSFFHKRKSKGSMSVEAALVMPLFIFAMLNLNSFMELYELSIEKSFSVYEKVRVTCAGSNFLSELGVDSDKEVMLFELYNGKPAIGIIGYKEIPLVSVFRAKPWTGYGNTEDDSVDNNNSNETVFVTPTGDAYHLSGNCPYLKLSIQMVGKDTVYDKRNINGEKYRPCEKCGGRGGDSVFITDYGNQYHTSLECSALKRTVLEINSCDIDGRHQCPKCMGF